MGFFAIPFVILAVIVALLYVAYGRRMGGGNPGGDVGDTEQEIEDRHRTGDLPVTEGARTDESPTGEYAFGTARADSCQQTEKKHVTAPYR